jgi:type I restriction enzyme S subunit
MNLVRLGDAVDFLDSRRRPVKAVDRNPGPYPYYGANGMQGTIDGFLFDEPLILLAEDGGHFFEPHRGIAYKISGKTWVNNHAHVLRPKKDFDIDFLKYALRNLDVSSYLTGSTRAKLTKAGASEIKFLAPDLKEQKRIAAILDAADALRAKRRESIEQLDKLAQSVFIDMFGDPVTNPKGWKTISLGDSCDFQSGNAWKAALFNNDGRGTPVVRIQNVGSGDYDLIHTQEQIIKSQFWINQGDLLLTLSGSFRLEAWHGERALLNQRIVKITPSEGIDRLYFESALRSNLMAIEKMGRHALVNNVAMSDLKNLSIAIPPADLQKKYASIISSLRSASGSADQHFGALNELFASLQSRAFSGSL